MIVKFKEHYQVVYEVDFICGEHHNKEFYAVKIEEKYLVRLEYLER